jgi:hypothetical protein
MLSIDQIARWVDPWKQLFSHSSHVSGTVTGLHILALFLGGGLAVAADRSTLRVRSRDRATRLHQLHEVQAIHPAILSGLVVLFLTGVLLAASDVKTFLPSPWFWIKLSLVALLLINGGVLTLTERRMNVELANDARSDPTMDAPERMLWGRMAKLAWFSIVLWTLTAVVGIVLSNVS